MRIKQNNLYNVDSSYIKPGQRVIRYSKDVWLPIGISTAGNVTVGSGQTVYVSETIPVTSATVSSNVVTISAGKITQTQVIEIGSAINASTYTPSVESQIISANSYLNGDQIILGDANLVSGNIKNGITLFGVSGILTEGVDTSDANATSNAILQNYSAYVDGQKINGAISSINASSYTPGRQTQVIISAGVYLNGNQTILGDTNLKASNIKSGVTIFGINGTYGEGGTGGGENAAMSDIDLFDWNLILSQ